MSADNAKLIAELLPRIDALLRNDLCKLYPLIVPILEDCRAALSVPSAPEVEAMVRRLRNFESFRAFELADMLESLDRRAALSAQSPTGVAPMNDPLKTIVDRFLAWKLPEHFRPDGGISFTPDYNQHTPWPAKHEPVGTNLFTAEQARAMFEHCLAGIALSAQSGPVAWLYEWGDECRALRLNRWTVADRRAQGGTETPLYAHPPLSAQVPPYPTGNVNGPCVCGSWPGGPCFRCPRLAEPGATEGKG